MDAIREIFASPWPTAWLAAAILLAILELIIPAFVCLFLSFGSVCGLLLALAGCSLELQITFSAVAIVASLFFLRPKLLARLHSKHHLPSRTEVLKGKIGVVTRVSLSSSDFARVSVEGEDWAASSDEIMNVGDQVQVVSADGIVLQVRSFMSANHI